MDQPRLCDGLSGSFGVLGIEFPQERIHSPRPLPEGGINGPKEFL
jgi:hypothetical protein